MYTTMKLSSILSSLKFLNIILKKFMLYNVCPLVYITLLQNVNLNITLHAIRRLIDQIRCIGWGLARSGAEKYNKQSRQSFGVEGRHNQQKRKTTLLAVSQRVVPEKNSSFRV